MITEVNDIPIVLQFIKNGVRVEKKNCFALRKVDWFFIVARSVLSWTIFLFVLYKLIF